MKTTCLAISVGALLSACAHPLPPMHVVHLDVVDHDGAYRPILRAKVAGKPLDMLLDTGAVQSVVPGAFAKRAGLGLGKMGDQYEDANGHLEWMYPLYDVPVQFEGEKEPGKMDFLKSYSLPDGMGILAPQSLVASGLALTIDLEKGELRYDTEKAALDRLRADGREPKEIDFHNCLIEGSSRKAHRLVPVVVNGVSTTLLLDTGAMRTTLARNNPALQTMLNSTGSVGTVGAVSSVGSMLHVADVPLEFAGKDMHVGMLVSPTNQICGRGYLGADVIHRCVLVWGASSLWASCRN